jgi:hypothetical protein
MAVDHVAGDLLVLSKRDRPARRYRVPLAASGGAAVVAEWIATLPPGVVDGEVTGLYLSSDGRTLAVLGYRGLYLWRREDGMTWRTALAAAPRAVAVPRLRKAEAMAFSRDHDAIFVGSERRPAPRLRIALAPPPG